MIFCLSTTPLTSAPVTGAQPKSGVCYRSCVLFDMNLDSSQHGA